MKSKRNPADPRKLRRKRLGLSESFWAEYHELAVKRRSGAITPIEYRRWKLLCDQLEAATKARLQVLSDLAAIQA